MDRYITMVPFLSFPLLSSIHNWQGCYLRMFFRPILIAHAYTDNLVDATRGYDKRLVLVISRSWYTLQHCSSYNKRQGQTLGTVSIAYVLLNPCFPGLGVNWKYLSAKQNTNCWTPHLQTF